MPRRALVVALFALAAPAAAHATVIGAPSGEPIRILGDDLTPVEGSVSLPAKTGRTALSPDGTQVAAMTPRKLVVQSLDGSAPPATYPARLAYQVLWPAPNRVVTVGSTEDGTVVRSLNVRTGRISRTVLHVPTYEGLDDTGRGLGAVLIGAHGIRVARFDNAGRRTTTFSLSLPRAIRKSPSSASAVLRGDVLHLQWGTTPRVRNALYRVSTGKRRDVELPDTGGYRWITNTILASGQSLVRVDRRTLEVVRAVDIPSDFETINLFTGGIVAGLGHYIFDRDLDLLTTNPDVEPYSFRVFSDGERLYHRTTDCGFNDGSKNALVVTDPRTGETLREVEGSYAIGILGGTLDFPTNDDCD